MFDKERQRVHVAGHETAAWFIPQVRRHEALKIFGIEQTVQNGNITVFLCETLDKSIGRLPIKRIVFSYAVRERLLGVGAHIDGAVLSVLIVEEPELVHQHRRKLLVKPGDPDLAAIRLLYVHAVGNRNVVQEPADFMLLLVEAAMDNLDGAMFFFGSQVRLYRGGASVQIIGDEYVDHVFIHTNTSLLLHMLFQDSRACTEGFRFHFADFQSCIPARQSGHMPAGEGCEARRCGRARCCCLPF